MQKFQEQETFVSAMLYITSRTLSPAAISAGLGLEPTRTELQGASVLDPSLLSGLSDQEAELMREMPNRLSCNYFILEVAHRVVKSTHDSSGRMLEKLLEELLKKIEPVADRFERLRGEISASIICSYGTYHKPEWFILSGSLMERAAALKLSITVLLAPLKGDMKDGT